ncbi:ankyrin repeat-containing domain protein [Pyronema omphalodes]|nr:ankyrin repeat-containing domain protein [Pyronema omphalodes]
MRLLLEGGADTGARDNDGWSSLHYATRYGHAEDEVLLLKERARIELEKPFHMQHRFWDYDLLHFPGFRGRGSHCIIWSYFDGLGINEAKAIIQMLLEKGADIEVRDNNGFSPLCRAARDGKVGMVQLLLEKGADPECHCNCGRTPLAWAARMENEGVVQLLLEKGANPSSKDKDWSTGCCYKESELHRC